MERFNDSHNTTVKLDDSKSLARLETAMAHGAVLRALDKENELVRNAYSSFGFRMDEQLNTNWEAHRGIRATYDKIDGFAYVNNVINWLIKKVTCYDFMRASWPMHL
jgi:hypothetical protein